MKRIRINLSGLCMVAGLLVGPPTLAVAQTYPTKPVTILVGFTTGGGTDITARFLAQKLTADLGQNVLVVNRPGASGAIAAEAVAGASPDGHMLLMVASATLTAVALRDKVPFSLERDFAPISTVTMAPLVFLIHPSIPVKNVKELIALARKNPGKLTFGSTGIGSGSQLAGDLFGAMANVNLLHVPFKSGGDSVLATASGDVAMNFPSLPASLAMMKAGRVRVLAVTTLKRSSMLPDVPTLDELGLKGYNMPTWYGLLAPAAVPKHVVARLHEAVVRNVNTAEMKANINKLGMEAEANTPAEFAAFMREQTAVVTKLGQRTGIKLE